MQNIQRQEAHCNAVKEKEVAQSGYISMEGEIVYQKSYKNWSLWMKSLIYMQKF